MKRFYKTAAVESAKQGFAISLDGKAIHTPAKNTLVVPTRELADAITAEWNAQGDTIDKSAMRLTRFSTIAIDIVGKQRTDVTEELLAYCDTDLLLHRAPDSPLAVAQKKHFSPALAWLNETHEVFVQLAEGIMPAKQPPGNVEKMRAAIDAFDDFRLSALSTLTHLTGSLFLSLYFLAGKITPDALLAAARLEENHQAEQWGVTDTHEDKEAQLQVEVGALKIFLSLLQ